MAQNVVSMVTMQDFICTQKLENISTIKVGTH